MIFFYEVYTYDFIRRSSEKFEFDEQAGPLSEQTPDTEITNAK